jgi:hypothetical protein
MTVIYIGIISKISHQIDRILKKIFKEVIISHQSQKDGKCNDQTKKRDKMRQNNLQNTTQILKIDTKEQLQPH